MIDRDINADDAPAAGGNEGQEVARPGAVDRLARGDGQSGTRLPAGSAVLGVKRQVVRLLILIPMVYLAVCLLVYLFQARLIYFPDRDISFTPSDVGLPFDNLTLTTSDGVSINAWYIPRTEALGSVIFCHGNAGNIGHALDDIHQFHSMGYNVLIFDYRGFGASEGSPTEKGTALDAEAVWKYLTSEKGESADRVVIFGRSLGGGVAIALAARHAPGALVVESTFTSLADVGQLHYPLLPVGLLCRYRYDSVKIIGDVSCPKLFIHGSEDTLIPIASGRRLFEAAVAPKQFLETPGDHGGSGFAYSDETIETTKRFLISALSL